MGSIAIKKTLGVIAALLFLASLVSYAQAPIGPSVPLGFKATKLASGLTTPADGVKGITSALFLSGDGPFGHDLYVARSDNGKIYCVSRSGAGATEFADVGDFPVGVAFSPYDSFGNYLYVGRAMVAEWGVVRVDPMGNVENFANVAGTSGLAFAPDGTDYGEYLYAATYWGSGKIYRIDSTGTATEFKESIPGQSRYLKFSHGDAFGTYLFVTEINSGKIYKVYPDASYELFADTGIGAFSIEGLDFSLGGAWGHYMWVGDAFGPNAGRILRIDPSGNVEEWATGFGHVADIHFQPGGKGGFTMYIVTAGTGEVWAISKA